MSSDVLFYTNVENMTKDLEHLILQKKQRKAISFLETIQDKNLKQHILSSSLDSFYGGNILMLACDKGLKQLALYLITEELVDLEVEDDHENTAILFCAKRGFTPVINAMMERGCLISHANYVGETLLILSCKGYELDIIITLINYNDENRRDDRRDDKINIFEIDDDRKCALDYLLTGDYLPYVRSDKFIYIIEWFLNKYKIRSDEDSTDVYSDSIDEICSNETLKRRLEFFCAEPKEATASFLVKSTVRPAREGRTRSDMDPLANLPIVDAEDQMVIVHPDPEEFRWVSPELYEEFARRLLPPAKDYSPYIPRRGGRKKKTIKKYTLKRKKNKYTRKSSKIQQRLHI